MNNARPVTDRIMDRLHAEALASEPADTDCVDAEGNVYAEHDYDGNECRRCGAEAEEAECGACGGPLASDGVCADDDCGAEDEEGQT